MIIRGTTPYHNFILPILAEDIDTLWVTYCQNEDEIIFRTSEVDDENMAVVNFVDMLENASMEQLSEEEKHCSQLTIHLTQEETLRFHFYPAAKKNIAVIHIRVLTEDGEAYASEPVRERIFGTRREGIIGQEEEGINENT
jgi:hypothetical protein